MTKVAVLSQILKSLRGFDKVIHKLKFVTANNGNCVAEMRIEDEHVNAFGTLHGGCSTTLVDTVSSISLLTYADKELPKVTPSICMNVIYLKGGQLGDDILIESKVLRVGRTLAFLEVEIRNKKTNDLLVKGEHTKYIFHAK